MDSEVIDSYAPLIIQFALALAIAVGGVIFSIILGQRGRKMAGKDVAYECGKDTVGSAQPRFSVKFYLVAMIFILFDIEVIFMYPWAVSFRELLPTMGWSVLWAMVFFVALIEVGHWYAYKKGVFDWNRR